MTNFLPVLRRIMFLAALFLIPAMICLAAEQPSGSDNLKHVYGLVQKYFPPDYYRFLLKGDQSQKKKFKRSWKKMNIEF